ncbi:Uu.00g030970.m01.CDS01 [Anthostomella pinea]|uniref:Uu.00g030970.m01.CDS01 n=1 Tax=Anthostomella pinea TaxID=933095 RepID=A0AAI8V891_9PEZI|nr:Uu.00g030970.m01.CDS01 [Anthostomella pinea]
MMSSFPGMRPGSSSAYDVPQMPPIAEVEDTTPAPAVPSIAESDDTAPPVPLKSPARRSMLNGPGMNAYNHPYRGEAPPAYSSFSIPSSSSSDIPPDQPPPKDRRPTWLVRRGGWCKVGLLALVTVMCLVGIIVGVVLGVRNSKNNSNNNSNTSQGPLPVRFPAGSYAFTAALSNTSTACTSNPATFRCYPYTTYNSTSSFADASTTFFWTIVETAQDVYTISSTANPFAPQFTNVSLALLDGGLSSERLSFTTPLGDAAVVPTGPIVEGSNEVTTCYYNDTVLSTMIWTRRGAQFGGYATTTGGNRGGDGSKNFDAWPYAVQVARTAAPGSGVPDCRNADGERVGDFAVVDGGGECGCWYANFGLES